MSMFCISYIYAIQIQQDGTAATDIYTTTTQAGRRTLTTDYYPKACRKCRDFG